MSGLPFAKFYWNDWAGDPLLRTCSFAAQGYWMRLLCIAAESAEPGFVLLNGKVPKIEDLVLVTGGTVAEVTNLIVELTQKGVCGKDRREALYSRRLVREEQKRTNSAKGGKIGGRISAENKTGIHATPGGTPHPYSKPESRSQSPDARRGPDFAQVIRLCSELGIQCEPTGNHKNWPGIVQRMIVEDGLDFDLDIIASVAHYRANGRLPSDVRTPTFFRTQAMAIADQRRTTKVVTLRPPEPMTAQLWAHRLKRWLECGIWVGPGTAPVYRSCSAPPILLDAARDRWARQGNHPEFADTDCNFPWKPEASPGMRGIIWPQVMAVEAEERAQA